MKTKGKHKKRRSSHKRQTLSKHSLGTDTVFQVVREEDSQPQTRIVSAKAVLADTLQEVGRDLGGTGQEHPRIDR